MTITILVLCVISTVISVTALVYSIIVLHSVKKIRKGLDIIHIDTERSAIHALTSDLNSITKTIYHLLDYERYESVRQACEAYDNVNECLKKEYNVHTGVDSNTVVQNYQQSEGYEDNDE